MLKAISRSQDTMYVRFADEPCYRKYYTSSNMWMHTAVESSYSFSSLADARRFKINVNFFSINSTYIYQVY